MAKRVVGVLVALAIVGGAVAGSKKSDPDTLARVGEAVGRKAKGSLPEASRVAGPLTAFRLGDRFPVEEQVRIRLQADKNLAGAEVLVAPGQSPGEVRLRGVVVSSQQAQHAVRLAEETVGVQKVINDLAVPEGK
jgi:hypothetical protein